MAYEYQQHRGVIFTDEGQRALLQVRDFARLMLEQAGAVQAGKLMTKTSPYLSDSWSMMAVVDRLVEIGDLREVPTSGAWQHRVFVGSA